MQQKAHALTLHSLNQTGRRILDTIVSSGLPLRTTVSRLTQSVDNIDVAKLRRAWANSDLLRERPLLRRRPTSTMATTTPGKDDDYSGTTQQSPLASRRAKESNTPSEANRTGKFGGYFTLGYKDGFSQWWANVPAAVAENNVMSLIPYLQAPPTQTKTSSKSRQSSSTSGSAANDSNGSLNRVSSYTTTSKDDPYGPRQWDSKLVQLSGKNRGLNEFSVERTAEEHDQSLVMLHGYGAGLGFFYKNFEGLSRAPGWKIYALDMPGMGRSTRPPFKIHAKDRQASITEAEDFFIDALEEWRIKRKIDRFTLLGHSLGGYMAVAYALKYPGHLNKLILASPVGIPEDPYAVNAAMPEPGTSTLGNEFAQTQDETTESSNPHVPRGDQNNLMNANPNPTGAASTQAPTAPRRPLPKWITYLWDANISPFSLVRWSGPLGPRFVSGWTSRRFSHLPPNEAAALHAYAYSLFKQRGSGEYALAYILAPGAFARSPLIRRIGGVGRQMITPSGMATSTVQDAQNRRENGLPVVMMYGENDWMDIGGGYAAEQKLKEEKEKAIKASGKPDEDKGEVKVIIIKKAGHHVYLDGWEEFNEVMLKEMEEVRKSDRGQ